MFCWHLFWDYRRLLIRRKAKLFAPACLGWLMSGELYLVAEGDRTLAVIGFAGSNIFYDSLLVFISSRDDLDRTFAAGFTLGYPGDGLVFTCTRSGLAWLTVVR